MNNPMHAAAIVYAEKLQALYAVQDNESFSKDLTRADTFEIAFKAADRAAINLDAECKKASKIVSSLQIVL